MENKTAERKLFLIRPASLSTNIATSNLESDEQAENGNLSTVSVNNPFLRCEEAESKPDEQEGKDPVNNLTSSSSATAASSLFKTNPVNTTNLFATQILSDNNSNFVFGQNLHERVVMEKVSSTPASEEDDKKSGPLFAITPAEKENPNDENKAKDENHTTEASGEEDKTESLVEAARKYEEMRGALKRKYEEVEITTGEEDERNIIEINCKLFTFADNNYEERGRGMLRLNDSLVSSNSRVVFRASGSLRVLLNTKIWKDQICEQPSQKSLRLTAIDTSGCIKIFLVMGRNEDMSQLYRALSSRIRKVKEQSPEPECTAPNEKSADVDGPAIKKSTTASE